MRRRGREFSIFTLSALDVLAMSTGVFVLLLVMLMPYYHREHDANAELDGVKAAAAETAAEVRTLEETATLFRAEAEAAAAEAAALDAAAAALEAEAAADRREAVARQTAQGAEEEERGGDIETPIVDQLDLVFAIDTTASMEPVLREVAVSLRSIVRILESLVPSVRIGIVAYRDHDTGTSLPPVVSLPLTDVDADGPGLRRVVSYLESLAASPVGSATIEEDVFPGLRVATTMPFRRDARQAIVLVGDAAAHAHEQVAAYRLASGFASASELRNISTLFVTTPSSLRAGNYARGFFVQLAQAGGGAFNEHTGSMIESVLLSVLVAD